MAICPEQGPTNIYLHEAREGGAMALHMYTAIYNHALDAQEIRDDLDAVVQVARGGLADARQWLQRMPFKPGEVPLSVAPHLEETLFNYYYRGEYDEWWAQECNDQTPYWDQHADIPCLITGGWYDPFVDACTGYFEAMKERIGSTIRLIIGPWTHTLENMDSQVGQVDFGPEACRNYFHIADQWFSRWLKDEHSEAVEWPPIQLFTMGANQWRGEHEWPLARTLYTPYYLHSGGQAQSVGGDGTLATTAPQEEPADEYHYDPRDPVMTLFSPGGQQEPNDGHQPDPVAQVRDEEAGREERGQLAVEQGKFTERHFIKPYRHVLEQWSADYSL